MAFIFVSYRSGDDGGYAEILVRDICATVRAVDRLGVAPEAFLANDDAMSSGDWTPEATDALARSTVFLAICSDRYLLTERCGREWEAFRERLVRHESATGRRPKAIVPLPWGAVLSETRLPGAEFVDPVALGEDVRALARLSSNRSRYHALVQRIAEHIVAVSRRDPVQPAAGLLSYPTTRNAFSSVRPAAADVRVVVAAYAEDQRPLAAVAQAVATEQLFPSELVADPERILELSSEESNPDEVVMLVDAWAARLAVVLPHDDDETVAARSPLRTALAELLARRGAHRDGRPWLGAESPERFSDELGEILEATRSLTFRSATVRRTAPGRPAGQRPILEAP